MMNAFRVDFPDIIPETLTTIRGALTKRGIRWEEKESCDVDEGGSMSWMTRIVLPGALSSSGDEQLILWFNGRGGDAELIWVSDWS